MTTQPRPSNRERSPKNKHGVHRTSWASWTPVAQNVFNKTYDYMMEREDGKNQKVIWNTAFIAAAICSRGEKHLLGI